MVTTPDMGTGHNNFPCSMAATVSVVVSGKVTFMGKVILEYSVESQC